MVQTDRSVSSPRDNFAQRSLRQQAPFSSLKACHQAVASLQRTRGLFHSTAPSSVAAPIATAARLVALRISRRSAVLAHVSFSSIARSPFRVDGPNHVFLPVWRHSERLRIFRKVRDDRV